MTSSPEGSPAPESFPGRRLLLLTFGATFLSRAVVGAVVESLRADLWLTDQALGTLATAFAGAYAVGLPVGAALGVRGRRSGLLAMALASCGAATAASAAAIGFWTLVAARVAAGAGAGLAAGAGLVILLDGGGRPVRARGLFLPATAGLALGYVLGGICGRTPGWRGAFIGSGALLVALAAAALRAGGPTRPPDDPWSSLRAEGWRRAVRRLVGDRARVLLVAASVTGASAASALAFWLPAFLERTRGVPRLVAGAQLGVAVLASGFAGAALGRAACRPAEGPVRGGSAVGPGGPPPAAGPAAGAWTAAGGAGAAAAAMAVALAVSSPVVVVPALMLALLGASAAARGAVSAFQGEAAAPALVALALLLMHGAGEVGGAFGLGAAADRVSFGRALHLLPVALAVSAALWAAAALAAQGRARRTLENPGRRVA